MTIDKRLEKRILILGSIKQARDLEFVFSLTSIVGRITSRDELPVFLDKFDILLICEGYEDQRIDSDVFEVMYDGEIIRTLAFPLHEKVRGRKIAIWGFGDLATSFTNQFKNRSEWEQVDCFFDNKPSNLGLEKNGIRVRSINEMKKDAYFIIIATNHAYYNEIEKQLQELGCDADDYVHYSLVNNDSVDMFYKTYREDSLLDATCKNLDRTLRINRTGDVCVCCMAYDGILGNLYFDDFDFIWNSMKAKVVRLSLVNRTFSFCNKNRCPFLSGRKEKGQGIKDKPYDFPFKDYPDCVAPEIDYSCNLYCTSCRNEVLVEKNKERMEYASMIVDRLAGIPSRFLINTVGEVFASANSSFVLEHEEVRKRDQMSIYTNGTLVNEKILNDLISTYADLEFSVSIDAATKETYEKIRRGGSFDRLMQAMGLLGHARKEGKLSYLQVNFVVQSDNIAEMEAFVKLAKTWNVDLIAMNGLEQWGSYTDEEFERVSIWRDGKLKEEFRSYFTKELIADESINFFNISNHIGAEAKFMYMV